MFLLAIPPVSLVLYFYLQYFEFFYYYHENGIKYSVIVVMVITILFAVKYIFFRHTKILEKIATTVVMFIVLLTVTGIFLLFSNNVLNPEEIHNPMANIQFPTNSDDTT